MLTTIIIFISAIAISLVEPDMSIVNGLWWSIVTVLMMFFGIGLLGMFSATVASILVKQKLQKERGLNSYRYRNHIILCE